MSKIHEALKKAQFEREANLLSSVQTAIAGTLAPERNISPASPVLSSTRSVTVPEHNVADSFGINFLREHCAKPSWKINSEIVLYAKDKNSSAGAEQFRTLRSRLYQLRQVRPISSLLITSALAGEGKTFVASNLAYSLARQPGRKVLMIDCDLRASQLHVPFGAPLSPGLADYLRGKTSLTQVMQRGTEENLYLIPGGNPVSDPTELLLNGKLADLLKQLAPTFDWIIVDSPPTLPVSDASSLADLCDGVLLVVQAAQTPFDAAQRASNAYRERNLVGAILNRVDVHYTYGADYPSGGVQQSRFTSGLSHERNAQWLKQPASAAE
jgi:capsular exopolysaccharide synthesis family protein